MSELGREVAAAGGGGWGHGAGVRQKRICVACRGFSSIDPLIDPDDAPFNAVGGDNQRKAEAGSCPSGRSGGCVDVAWARRGGEAAPVSLRLPPGRPFPRLSPRLSRAFPRSFLMLLAEIKSAGGKVRGVHRGRNLDFCNGW